MRARVWCVLQAMVEKECVGAIVCKLDMHKKMFRRGYIAMLAVDSKHRRKSIGENPGCARQPVVRCVRRRRCCAMESLRCVEKQTNHCIN